MDHLRAAFTILWWRTKTTAFYEAEIARYQETLRAYEKTIANLTNQTTTPKLSDHETAN